MRLIDADALEAKLEEQRKLYIEMDMKEAEDLLVHDVLHYVWEAPTIDAVQVVRCMVCKHSRKDELWHMRWCKGLTVKDEHFCADGERKDNETD